MSSMVYVLNGACPQWGMSSMGHVLNGACPQWDMSSMGYVLNGACPQGACFRSGKISLRPFLNKTGLHKKSGLLQG